MSAILTSCGTSHASQAQPAAMEPSDKTRSWATARRRLVEHHPSQSLSLLLAAIRAATRPSRSGLASSRGPSPGASERSVLSCPTAASHCSGHSPTDRDPRAGCLQQQRRGQREDEAADLTAMQSPAPSRRSSTSAAPSSWPAPGRFFVAAGGSLSTPASRPLRRLPWVAG